MSQGRRDSDQGTDAEESGLAKVRSVLPQSADFRFRKFEHIVQIEYTCMLLFYLIFIIAKCVTGA